MLYELVEDPTKPLIEDGKSILEQINKPTLSLLLFNILDLDSLTKKLENELNETKNEIKRILEVKYDFRQDFEPLLNKCEKYEKQIDFLNNQISLVKNEIKEKVGN